MEALEEINKEPRQNVSLTTMGYGAIYPVTTAGKLVTTLSSFVGIAIAALPAGIITAGYMDETNKRKA